MRQCQANTLSFAAQWCEIGISQGFGILPQRHGKPVRAALIHDPYAPGAIAEALEDELAQRDGLHEPSPGLVLTAAYKDQHPPCPESSSCQQNVGCQCGCSVECHGQDVGRQPVSEACDGGDQGLALGEVVQQQHGRLAAGPAVGGEQGAQPIRQCLAGWQGIGDGPCRADGLAATTAGTDRSVNGDAVPGRDDGAGGTDIETTRATRFAAAAMGTKGAIEGDVAGLVELAHHIRQIKQSALDRQRIPRIRAHIAVARGMGWK